MTKRYFNKNILISALNQTHLTKHMISGMIIEPRTTLTRILILIREPNDLLKTILKSREHA